MYNHVFPFNTDFILSHLNANAQYYRKKYLYLRLFSCIIRKKGINKTEDNALSTEPSEFSCLSMLTVPDLTKKYTPITGGIDLSTASPYVLVFMIYASLV